MFSNDATSKIGLTLKVHRRFISKLFVEGSDRAMVASFGNTFRVETDYTDDKSRILSAFDQVERSVRNEKTRQNESIVDAVTCMESGARPGAQKVFITSTDGKQDHVESKPMEVVYDGRRYQLPNPLPPEVVGFDVRKRFINSPNAHAYLIGAGHDVDAAALLTIGAHGGFPAIALEDFEMFERHMIQVAFRLTTEVERRRYRIGDLTWDEIGAIRQQIAHVATDYLFLIDRSGSMRDRAFPAPQQPRPSASTAGVNNSRFSVN